MQRNGGYDVLKDTIDTTEIAGAYGHRLLPQIADAYATSKPDKIWGSIARSSDFSQGFQDITFKQLAHAVNYTAWLIDGKIGRSNDFEAIAYMGSADLRYTVLALAAIKCGYQILLPSVRNSESGNLSLLNELKITHFICSEDVVARIEDLQVQKPNLQIHTVPLIEQMIEEQTEHYPYEKTFEEAQNDPIIICHTSGSTGAPKPIELTNWYFAAYDNHRKLSHIGGQPNVDYASWDLNGERYYNTFPPFHIAGIIAQAMIPLLYDTIVTLGPADKPPSGDIGAQIMQHTKIRAWYTSPPPIEQMLLLPEGPELARTLDFVIFSGGPMSPSSGDHLSTLCDIGQYIGSTEIGIIPCVLPDRDTWNYFEWHPSIGCEMEHVAEDIYELIIPYKKDLRWIRPHPERAFDSRFKQTQETGEWRTKDLFRRHPKKPKSWRFYGRTDDIIVLNNGEKFNPVTMEGIILGSPLLSGALIVGQGKFQAALLLEPKASIPRDTLIEKVWPDIEKANIDGPTYARIFRSKVLIIDAARPFARVGKGTVARGAVCKDYAVEIDALYSEEHGDASQIPGLPKLVIPDPLPTIKQFLRSYMATFLAKKHFSDTDDFFSLGLDSVQTLEFTRGLKIGFSPIDQSSSDMSWLSASLIYRYPTVSSLADFLNKGLKSGSAEDKDSSDEQRAERMEAMIERYISKMRPIDITANSVLHENGVPNGTMKLNVALTGSTGTLGTHILEALLKDPTIGKVFCLNRSNEAQIRQGKSFQARGVSRLLDLSRVTFLTIGLGQAQFGLLPDSFAKLTSSVDVIIHNAWKVDFNHQLDSFESQIRAVADFTEWSATSSRHPHLIFISSLASVGNWFAHYQGPVPESPVTDSRVAQQMGYGESKHVAEQIFQFAQEKCGVPATILRVGQIAGPSTPNRGVWNKAEWLPSLVQTSKALGSIPESLPDPVDWIPVDQLSNIILEIMHHDVTSREGGRIYNLVNPTTTEWTALVPTIQHHFKESKITTEAVPLAKWIQQLRVIDVNSKAELAAKPAAKIVEFYADMVAHGNGEVEASVRFETGRGLAASETMAALDPVSEALMRVWLEGWGF